MPEVIDDRSSSGSGSSEGSEGELETIEDELLALGRAQRGLEQPASDDDSGGAKYRLRARREWIF